MFGEKELIGTNIIKIHNNKIDLPDYSLVEPKEILVFLKHAKYVCLFSKKTFENHLSNTLPLLSEHKKSDRDFIRFISKKMVRETIVNSKKQIILPGFITEEYDNLDKVIIEGNKDHLKLYFSKDLYKEYKKSHK